jgi:glycine/D-amino acid oxidase-like deaminating enzyme
MLDAIIVGQGIAGSCLALSLIKRGKKILIIDDDWKGAACKVAAGVLNPITGKRLAKSWRSDTALPFAKQFYKELQEELGEEFYQERKILQLCKSQEEAELWAERKNDPEYSDFLSNKSEPNSYDPLNDNFGSFLINFAAWVEAPAAMKALRKYFLEQGILNLEPFDYSQIKPKGCDGFSYKILNTKRIIFCEGWRAIDNPYFNWLPYRPAKGEILNIVTPVDLGEHIIHREKWIMKFKNQVYRCGSTWDRINFRNPKPTATAKEELFNALPKIIGKNTPFHTFTHEAGVRPCTATTRPHLGEHPTAKGLYSFNGFGSKGYALSPYFANHFARYLDGEIELDSEANLSRHVKKFFNGNLTDVPHPKVS